jgi:glycosyltransferase involved in cell wall biosynthesis
MTPEKGVHIAIEVARAAGLPLRIAAKMREPAEFEYFENEVQPLLGGDIEYLGEVDAEAKAEMLSSATALLNPIQWDEPFGLTMVEALACGTPVVATRRGSAPEIVEDGVTGFVCDTSEELVTGVLAAKEIDRAACRSAALTRFSMDCMVDAHERLFTALTGAGPGSPNPLGEDLTAAGEC